jgi:hypothetical protein
MSQRKADQFQRATQKKSETEAEYAHAKEVQRFKNQQLNRGIAKPIGARFPLREGTGSQRLRRR